MKTVCVPPPDGVTAAVDILAAGGLVALPTETVYGLAAHALDPLACAQIFEAKDRPLSDPLIVHVPDAGWLDRLARPGDLARRLAERFWPGPLTLVLPRTALIPDVVTDGQPTVALRQSAHPVFAAVVERFGRPLAAPSANRFGRISPTQPAHVLAELSGRIPLVVDGGSCAHGIESTIVLVHADGVEILRHGPVTAEELAVYCPMRSGGGRVVTPGSMESHYAPRTPLQILPPGDPAAFSPADAGACGLLAFSRPSAVFGRVEVLSPRGDLREAAANLYGAMRRLDDAGLRRIFVEPIGETGLGVAVMERLRKAAAGFVPERVG